MEQTVATGAAPDEAAMRLICNIIGLPYGKITDDEKDLFKKITEKSDLLKNPNPQRGRKKK